jgi:hypothetical protein
MIPKHTQISIFFRYVPGFCRRENSARRRIVRYDASIGAGDS